MKITINKNKRIGDVIFIVEGRKTEPSIITSIFEGIYNYSVYKINKNEDIIELRKTTDKYNKVAIVVNDKPQITQVGNTEYLNRIFRKLSMNNFDPHNASTYFLFDRDESSNSSLSIISLMNKLVNSRDNYDYDMNGILLLSYPCVEAFYCNCNNDKTNFSTSKEIKKYVNINKYKHICENGLTNAMMIFSDFLENQLGINFKIDMLDDFSDVNKIIFSYEEEHFKRNKSYITLSLLVVALMDLGLIMIDED